MTHLTSPAAIPAAGISNIVMADIIDSLKRLERIGSESSKTVEKIIEAARDLEVKITDFYRRSEFVELSGSAILMNVAEAKGNCSLQEAAESFGLQDQALTKMRYSIYEQKDGKGGLFRANERVSGSREAALKFSNDLANGLLTLVELDLLTRQKENQKALGIFKDAAEHIESAKQLEREKEAELYRRPSQSTGKWREGSPK